MTFQLGASQTSGDNQSKQSPRDSWVTAGDGLLVLLIGLVVVGAGVAIIVGAVRKTFIKHLSLAQMSPRTRTVVETLGLAGSAARGIVAGVAGVFLAVAAVTSDAKKAQGLDGTLRNIAAAPLARGCSSRWRSA